MTLSTWVNMWKNYSSMTLNEFYEVIEIKRGKFCMMQLEFTPRSELSAYEHNNKKEVWKRPDLDREVLKQLSQRSTINGLWRIGMFIVFLVASAVATLYVSRYNLFLAIPLLYTYYFFYGFWVAIGHELQHKTVFAKSFDWFSEILFFVVHVIMWNSPRYARISHQLHHRYTMVRSVDPETNWPEVVTVKWLRKSLLRLILRILAVGAVPELFNSVKQQVQRIMGKKDLMMSNYCSDKDIRVIRMESLAILLIHLAVVIVAILFRRWELLFFITFAWQIGAAIEVLWHSTEHIGRLYNVNDHRLNTRSIQVNPLIKLIFWGLDDHVDHHLFPAVPSRNLPQLHRILAKDLAKPMNMIGCWREMFAIAREKDKHPESEYVPVNL
jgi:fatty acid desaturase